MAKPGGIRIISLMIMILLLLSAWFLYFKVLLPGKKNSRDQGKISLTGNIDRDNITNLGILYNDGTNNNVTIISILSNKWYITSPVTMKADNDSVAKVIDDLPGIVSESVITDATPGELRDLGFDKPVLIIEFPGGPSRRTDIVCGGVDSTGKYFYTEVNGDESRIYLVYIYKFNSFAKTWKDFRDREILTIPIGDIKMFSLKSGAINYAFLPGQTPGTFIMTSPQNNGSDSYKIKSIIMNFYGLSVNSFIDSPVSPSAYGLTSPLYTFRVISKGGYVIELSVGLTNSKGDYYADSPGKGYFLIDGQSVNNAFNLNKNSLLSSGGSN